MKKIGLIGLGAMARYILNILEDEKLTSPTIVGILEQPERHEEAKRFLKNKIPVVGSLSDLLALKPDVVAEAAGQSAVKEYGEAVLRAEIDLLIISIGTLADQNLLDRLTNAAKEAGSQILLPAGALAGIDALAAARIGGLTAVRQRLAKPPKSWKSTPAEEIVNLEELTEATVFFEGTAREAATMYPQNANVAASVALAGLGFDKSRIELVADPLLNGPLHTIEAEGTFGNFKLELQGRPLEENPKTSVLASLSLARSILNTNNIIAI